MNMLLTTLVLLLVTTLCVLRHLRGRPMPRKAVAVRQGSPCRRCQTDAPLGAAYCPGCGVALRFAGANPARRKPAEAQPPPRPSAVRKAPKPEPGVSCVLGVPGDDLDKVLYDLKEAVALQGKRLLVVGGGNNAVDSALRLAKQNHTKVFLSCSEERLAKLDPRYVAELSAAVKAGRIKVLLKSRVRKIRKDAVILEVNGRLGRLLNDNVIVRLEGGPPSGFRHLTGAPIGGNDVPSPNWEVASAG